MYELALCKDDDGRWSKPLPKYLKTTADKFDKQGTRILTLIGCIEDMTIWCWTILKMRLMEGSLGVLVWKVLHLQRRAHATML